MRPGFQVAQRLICLPVKPCGHVRGSLAYRPATNRSPWTGRHCESEYSKLPHCLSSSAAFKSLDLPLTDRGKRQYARLYSTREREAGKKNSQELPSSVNERRSDASKRFSRLMDRLESSIFIAGQRLNDLTGYTGIDALRRDIDDQEKVVQSSRKALQEARGLYSQAISTRASSQREVNQLLQRKNAWSPEDLERFTALYRSDHANEHAETSAREALSKVEDESEEAAAKLTSSILARYHEEQIWSDKIRRISTWGTLALMGVNVLLFLVFQVGVEPWRRKRLVRGFEQKVQEALREAAETLDFQRLETPSEATVKMDSTDNVEPPPTVINNGIDAASSEPSPVIDSVISADAIPAFEETGDASALEYLRAFIADLFSDRQVIVRRLDLTTAIIEGAAAGVVVVGFLVLFLRPR